MRRKTSQLKTTWNSQVAVKFLDKDIKTIVTMAFCIQKS